MIKPHGALLLIEENKVEDRTTATGLVLSAAFNDSSLRTGRIVDMGDGEYNYKGDLVPINGLDINDIVYYPQHGGTEVEDEDGTKYLLLNSKNVLAIKS